MTKQSWYKQLFAYIECVLSVHAKFSILPILWVACIYFVLPIPRDHCIYFICIIWPLCITFERLVRHNNNYDNIACMVIRYYKLANLKIANEFNTKAGQTRRKMYNKDSHKEIEEAANQRNGYYDFVLSSLYNFTLHR